MNKDNHSVLVEAIERLIAESSESQSVADGFNVTYEAEGMSHTDVNDWDRTWPKQWNQHWDKVWPQQWNQSN